jgi:hypothetical protein
MRSVVEVVEHRPEVLPKLLVRCQTSTDAAGLDVLLYPPAHLRSVVDRRSHVCAKTLVFDDLLSVGDGFPHGSLSFLQLSLLGQADHRFLRFVSQPLNTLPGSRQTLRERTVRSCDGY